MQVQNQIQTLIHTTFSCIAYLRDLLDDSCFEDQTLGVSKIKKIIRTKESQAILDLLQGMNEAVMLKYLHKFEVALYLDKERSQEIHESYTFEINYGEEEDANEKQTMIRNFCLLLQRLKPLPPDKFATIKLYYNDTVPLNYNPRGFKDGTLHSFNYNKEKLNFECGMKSVVPKEIYLCDIPEKSQADEQNVPSTFIMTPSEKTEIKCYCGDSSDTFDIIQCDKCFYWLHTVCCGFYSNTDKRIPKGQYICLPCTGQGPNKQLAIMRKFLSVVYNEGLRSREWLLRRLGITKIEFEGVYKRVLEEGFMQYSGQGKFMQTKVLKNEKVKKKIKDYFRTTRTSIPKEDVRCRQPKQSIY